MQVHKRLWVISELYYPETTSTGFILTRLAEGLSKYFSVTVICGQPTYSARGIRAPISEVRNQVHIQRCWGTTLDKDILLFRLTNLITLTFSIFLSALTHIKQGEQALVVTNPPTLPFAIVTACKLKRAKCSLIIHDIYPDLAIAAGKLKVDSLLARIWDRLNARLYQGMEHIFVLGRDMYIKVSERLDNHKERVRIATNWADCDTITPQPKSQNTLLVELGLQDKFVLQYAGNMGYPNDIVSIIEAAILLKDCRDIHFLFIGSGVKRREIEFAIVKNNLSNVTLLNPRPRNDQSNFLNACDVALVALVNGMKGVSVPSRTYNILAAGKPIIAIVEQGSELAMLIEEKQVGWIVPPHQPEKLVSTILEVKSQSDFLSQISARARQIAESEYSFQNTLKVFLDSLDANEKV